MNEMRFFEARARVLSENPLSAAGIGTLSEKSLHRIFKLYLEPNEEYHEIPFMSSIADIKREEHIYEIQTHSTEKLLPKLFANAFERYCGLTARRSATAESVSSLLKPSLRSFAALTAMRYSAPICVF